MSLLRKFRRNIEDNSLMFDTEMYNNCVGSLVITHFIISEEDEKPSIEEIKATWKKLRKSKNLGVWLNDKDFIPRVLKLFGFKCEPKYGKFAMVQSEYNILFCPYIDEHILPVREDGVPQRTLVNGKIYPVEEGKDVVSE